MGLAPMSSNRWPRKLWPLAVFFRLLAGCATTETPPSDPPSAEMVQIDGDVEEFGQWYLGCSNLGNCTAIARVREYDAGLEAVHIRFSFDSDIKKRPAITIVREGELIQNLDAVAAQSLTDSLRTGDTDDVPFISKTGIRLDVPREGFLAAMVALSAWQDRPQKPKVAAELIIPIPATRIENVGDPSAFTHIAKRCPKGHMGESLQGWRGMGGSLLWRAGCGNEGLNLVSFWFLSGPQGAPPELVDFSDADGSVHPFNSWFQDSSGYLRMIHYFGGQEDCGVYRVYAWDVGGMKLVEKRLMPICGTGIGPKGWITTYRATILNGSDSGP